MYYNVEGPFQRYLPRGFWDPSSTLKSGVTSFDQHLQKLFSEYRVFVRHMGRGGGPPPSPGARSWSTSSSFSINDHHFMPPSIPLVIASSIISLILSVSFQNIVFSSYHHNWKPSRQVRMCRRGQGATLSNWRRTCEPPSSYRWHQIREGFKNPSHGIRPLGG